MLWDRNSWLCGEGEGEIQTNRMNFLMSQMFKALRAVSGELVVVVGRGLSG